MSTERLRKEYQVNIFWRAFPLHTMIPEEGLSFEELYAGRKVQLKEGKARAREAAKKYGLTFTENERVYNTRLAQEMGAWAETRGKGDEFHNKVFRAYFVDRINIGNISSLINVATSVGLPEREAQKVLEDRAFREVIDFDWSYCRIIGVKVIPTAVIGEHALVGTQPYEAFKQLMNISNGKRREEH